MTYEEIICDANNLYKAYKASIKGSKWKETTQKFMINFLRYLIAIQDDLLNRTLQNGPTGEFSLSERGRIRPITSICTRDRIVRHVFEFIDWLLTLIFDGFKIDVSYMSDEEYASCMEDTFNKLDYRNVPKNQLTGEKWMYKSVNIGDQLSQIIGIYYPYRIDNYVKYVRQQKFYGRYMDDWYIMNPSKEELQDLLENICMIAKELGIHINMKKTRIVKISSTYKYLQIRYSLTKDGKIIKRINPSRVTAMRRKLKKLAVKVQNGEILYEHVENMFRSWMGSFYKLLSRQQRQNLISLYEELFDKRITIVKKKMIVIDKTIAEWQDQWIDKSPQKLKEVI